MKLFYQYMTSFSNFSPNASHLYPLQAENCDSNSRLVVDKDDNGKFRLDRVLIEVYAANPIEEALCCPFDITLYFIIL